VVEAQERRRGHLATRSTTLSGRRDDEFVADAGDGDEQELMARLTVRILPDLSGFIASGE
jgi:hypothetical protein